MTAHTATQGDTVSVHDEINGYRVEAKTKLEAIDAVLYRLTHLKTGARHVHVAIDDQENTFGVTLKTVPTDSTGVAHILEHTALCGSKRYPVRDPFFSMLKRSLSTFMNAFTSSDWTMYPFSTQNPKDYYQLMDVYLDAVFFPLLDELSFKQEGHRLETEKKLQTDPPTGLVYKGVVYNEMKGAMSSPDQIMARSMLKALYPDTVYSNNSGGDPMVIPILTHEQLIAFHKRHYHPSNAFFYTYGHLPLKDHLSFISDKVMSRFDKIDPETDVAPQPRWPAPRHARFSYPLASDEDPDRKSQISLAWLLCDIGDTFEILVLAVLEQILIGNAGSPLRKALMESEMGGALSDASGFDADNRDTLFACGLKDTRQESADAIEKLIFDVLRDLADKGIDRQLIDSAIHQIEFHRKEITNTPYPYGLKILLTIIGSWLHGNPPERILQLEQDFETLRKQVDKGGFLEERIRHYFLNNPHCLRIMLVPDQKQAEREKKQEEQRLHDLWRTMEKDQVERIDQDAARLKASQEALEDVSCLPTLALSDIPPLVFTCKADCVTSEPALWRYNQATSGIFYFMAAAGVASLPQTLLPWVPFFCFIFNQLGTQECDYPAMARKIDAAMGGFRLSAAARTPFEHDGGCVPMVTMTSKCLTRNIKTGFDIIGALMAGANYSDTTRLRQLLGEYKAGLESMIVQNGHRLAISRSARTLSQSSAISEIWNGIEQIKSVRTLSKQLSEDNGKGLGRMMADIADALFAPGNIVMAAIGDGRQNEIAVNTIQSGKILNTFSRLNSDPRLPVRTMRLAQDLPFEGWRTSTAVSFVAQTIKTAPLGHQDAPALAVLSKMLRSLYLHREIREKGGAYGGFSLYNPENGLFSLASYRDPHVVRTMDVFSRAGQFLSQSTIQDDDLKEAVLQVCSEIDKPDPPGPAAQKAFSRLIIGLNDEARLAFKQQLLGLTKKQVLATADNYFKQTDIKGGLAVIAGRDHLDEANRRLAHRPLILENI